MFYYIAFGLRISSEIELHGMIENVDNNKSDVEISLGEVNFPISGDIKGFNYIKDHEEVYLWWEDIGKVKISNGSKITVDLSYNSESSDKMSVVPFLLGSVMSILLHQRGFLVLHGSAVKINDYVVAFLGYKGLGKSTIAINLYKKGYPLVTDDILAIKFDNEGLPVVYPSYPHVRLSKDSFVYMVDNTNSMTPICTLLDKIFCDTSRGFLSKSIKLKKIYVLESSDEIRISILKSQKNLINIIRHSFANKIFDNIDQAKNLTQCANLVNKISFRRLEVSHSFKNLPNLINLVEEDFICE